MGSRLNRNLYALVCAMSVSVLSLHCGARTDLAPLAHHEPSDASTTDSSVSDAGQEVDSTPPVEAGPEASLDAPPDSVEPDAAVTRCVLDPLGQPQEVFGLTDVDLHTPSLVVLDTGDVATGQLGRVALQAVSGGIRLIALTVQVPTPAGTVIDANEAIHVGNGSTYGHMVHAPGGLPQLALVWGSDGPGNLFRTVDIPSWTLGPLVQVAQTGWTPNGLAAGKGVPNTQTGQYEGEGYGMTWQHGASEAASVAVLSATGAIQVGPLSTSASVPSGYLESSIGWSGSTYLVAGRFESCASGDPLCRERAVVVSRIKVAPASNSIQFASSFEVGTPGWSPGRPTLDGVFMVWDEGPSDSEGPRVVHVEQLDQDGVPVGPDHVVSTTAWPLVRVFTGTAPEGRLVGWAEHGDETLPDDTLGRSVLRLQPMTPGLAIEEPLLSLPISRFGSIGKPAIVSLEYPRGVLIAWAARSLTSPRYAIFAQFLPCAH